MKNKILIDYFGGAHGHFLEYILNALEDDELLNQKPFNDDGTCRFRLYTPNSRRFHADHFSMLYYKNHIENTNDAESPGDCVAIVFEEDHSDWLLYVEVAVLRASHPSEPLGPVEELHIKELKEGTKYVGYNLFRNGVQRYGQTKSGIRQLFLDHFIRDPLNSPPYKIHQVPFLTHKNIIDFKFIWFYNYEQFIKGIEDLAKRFDLTLDGKHHIIKERHEEFIRLNRYATRNSFERCNEIFDNLNTEMSIDLNTIEEAYICKLIEQQTGVTLTKVDDEVFTSTNKLREFINEVSIRH